jgi:hypothetical protein
MILCDCKYESQRKRGLNMSLANYALDNTKENSVVILFYDLELPSWCSNWEYLSLS